MAMERLPLETQRCQQPRIAAAAARVTAGGVVAAATKKRATVVQQGGLRDSRVSHSGAAIKICKTSGVDNMTVVV